MTGKFNEGLGTPEIKIPDKDMPQTKMDYPGIPSLDDIKEKFDEIFQKDFPQNEEEKWEQAEFPKDTGRITLDDGTVIELPKRPWEMKNVENSESHGDSNHSDIIQNDVKPTRELTEDEKQRLKDVLGWNDNQIDKCSIDEDGVIHYRTDRCDLEGKTSENGVPYERKQIVINGITIEGVFPKFDSTYTTELPPDKLKSNTYAKECNEQLKEAVQNDPELRSKFTDEQLNDIKNNRTPTGYVWHHNETPGKMELVKRSDHDRAIGGAAHTGGSALWGPDSVNKTEKGESF